MMRTLISERLSAGSPRAQELFDESWRENARRTDRMFAALMLLQWIGSVILALTASPRTWEGSQSHVHPHIWLSFYLGAALASLPVYFAWKYPGRAFTRHVIALAQMMFSSLLIQVSGGRIETHFHVFGSLAFLAFYRDWKVLVPATLLVACDHFLRGVYWPQTVFGITTAAPWRWLEHAAWVIYEDVFLFIACAGGVRDMWSSAVRTAELERMNRDMQQQTKELETAYRSKHAIVETALDAVVSMDDRGRITGWNSQAEAVFGWTAAEVRGQSVAATIIPSSYRMAHQQGLKRFLEIGESAVLNKRIEVVALHRDGHEFPVELSIAPIKSQHSVSFCAFARDITSRQQAADALRSAKEAAEAASNAKSAFLANMSHEIRTPLNAILGFTDVLTSNTDATPQQRNYLQTIHDSGRHLLTLINDMLDLSKIESGQMQIEAVRCSPHEIIAATISVLRVRAEERGLTLEYFWKSEIPDTIQTDPARLRQILINLVANAIKFTEVGSVQVAARLVRGDSVPGDSVPGAPPQLVIDVIDTGVGIDSEAAQRIFEPFVQADSSITRRFGGTGLGLSISRRLARLLGGDLAVSSEVGRGSIFTLSVPAGSLEGVRLAQRAEADVAPSAPKFDQRTLPTLPPCRILLVEDGATNRKLISLILERAGASVQFAENGQEGVEVAAGEPFDLILMDMQMPVMDGYTATGELRRLGCTLPIIALTAHAMASDERKCREAGCSGYLTKPIDRAQLLTTVGAALQQRPAASENAPIAGKSSNPQEPIFSRLPADDAEFCEIVAEFVGQFERKLAELDAALTDGDLRRVAELGHWVKGAGGTAGFDELTRPAAELEATAKAGQREKIAPLLERLHSLLERLQVPVHS